MTTFSQAEMSSAKRVANLVIRTVREVDLSITKRILIESFASEPVNIRGKLLQADLEKFVELSSDTMVKDGLSLAAYPNDNNVPGGAIFAHDLAKKPSEEAIKFISENNHFSKLIGLMDHLEYHYSNHHKLDPTNFPFGHSVHILMMGTKSEFRNMGIASKLLVAALKHYTEKNYTYCMAECSGDYSRKAFEKAGFDTLLSLPYAEWFPPHSEYVQGVETANSTMTLMMKKLN